LLQTPDWASEEKAELGPRMRGEVTRWQNRKNRLQRRLAWDAESHLSSIDTTSVFAPSGVVSMSITSKDAQTSTLEG
jgi:hypothetical protein